ncbi:uncharacterized protein LOC110854188 [Folsomia candida]|uniref:Putative calcium-binding protein CML25 n=1 Tax=Folsomia candida TaxID=158441 RepID=A0A226DZ32_FOLCA|nr:uncharacterized protein LOC110854188 [Folsomia candida]OXA50054.1 putative calcium-binding protein CML25 [Folsomia candida]
MASPTSSSTGQILTNKDGTWASFANSPVTEGPWDHDPTLRRAASTPSNHMTQNLRASRETTRPLKWYQKITIHSILGGAVRLLKRLTTFPMLSSAAIYFDEDDRFDPSSGNVRPEPTNDDEAEMSPSSEQVEIAVNYEKATQALFEAIIRYRKESKAAKDNYHTVKVDLKQFPEWNDVMVDRLRSTLQVFDITGDGLLDFEEFCTTLEEFGDITSIETRKKYFATIDDGSGSIDFLEFIRLVYKVTVKTPPGAEDLAITFQSIDRNMARIRSLDVVQQLQAGLF